MAARADAPSRAHVLFVTRRFPPSVGGMQTLSAEVDRALRASGATVELVALRAESNMNLVWFIPLALLRTLLSVVRNHVTHVVCGDAVAWAVVAPAVNSSRVRTAVLVHGLDLTFPNRLYQRVVVRWALPRAARLVANSSATRAVATERTGIDRSHIVIVNPRVLAPSDVRSKAAARAELVQRAELDLGEDTLILTTVGRLVRRKGVEWFVEHVIPRLRTDARFIVAGEGPRAGAIESLVERLSLSGRVKLLGRVDSEYREMLLRGADICVLPNISVSGDMEGFGIVAVEAAVRGTLVIASAIEGIQDAVIDGVTGVAVETENATAFTDVIDSLAIDRDSLSALSERYRREACKRFTALDAGALLEALGLERL